MQKKKYFKENKASGITLIALVITIFDKKIKIFVL